MWRDIVVVSGPTLAHLYCKPLPCWPSPSQATGCDDFDIFCCAFLSSGAGP